MFKQVASLPGARVTGLCGAALFLTSPFAAAQLTERVSLDSTGAEAIGDSSDARVSEDGRYVVFSTYAALVSLDTNAFRDVYRYDRNTGTVDLVSTALDASGNPVVTDGDSLNPSVSSDGMFVAFETSATNLGSNMADTNGFSDIYVREYSASGATTNRVSLNYCPLPSNPALEGNGHSRFPDISAETFFLPGVGNVHTIVFESDATNLVGDPGNGCVSVDTNGATDIFFSYEGNVGWFPGPILPVTHLITFNSGLQGNLASGGQGIPAAAVSATGLSVAFSSAANNLVPSGGDTNGVADVFVVDLGTGGITRVSVDSSGAEANGPSTYPAVNADATRVAFQSSATNLVAGGNSTPDVFMHDLITGVTIQASQSTAGVTGNGSSGRPDISADGAFVAFESQATNLIPGDNNGAADVFVHSVLGRSTLRSSLSSANAQGDLASTDVCLTENGSQMVFTSHATDLVNNDTNNDSDVFFRGCDAQASVYCTAKVNSLSCVPSISFNGSPSATVGSGFHITTRNLINQTTGLYLFSVNQQGTPVGYQGGWVCFGGATIKRSPGAATGGSGSGTDCSGVIDMDFNTVMAAWTDPVIQMGDTIYVQCWSRDVADPFGSSFSDAVVFTVCD